MEHKKEKETTKRLFKSSISSRQTRQSLELTYLFQDLFVVRFLVSCLKPYKIQCSSLSNQKENQDLLQSFHSISEELNGEGCTNEKKTLSLFLVVSRLAMKLDQLEESSPENASVLSKPILSQDQRLLLDLQVFLMRCAATSSNSANLCTPLPLPWEGAQGHHVLSLSDNPVHRSLKTEMLASPENTNQSKQLLRRKEELLAFFKSLPSTNFGRLAISCPKRGDAHDPSTISSSSACHKIDLTLDLMGARGDDSPKFTALAEEFGTVTAFHGTQIDNIWSILNYGLMNLSNHDRMRKNGAIMGDGVYLSTSRDVAYFFATSQSQSRLDRRVWERNQSFWNLIQGVTDNGLYKDQQALRAKSGKTNIEMSVACYAVIEATIIRPPPPTRGGSVPSKNLKGKTHTRRNGKYFVVSNPEDYLRMEKIHLTIELKRQEKSFWNSPPFRLALLLFFALY